MIVRGCTPYGRLELTVDNDYFHIEIQCRSLTLNISNLSHM